MNSMPDTREMLACFIRGEEKIYDLHKYSAQMTTQTKTFKFHQQQQLHSP